jgi:hypothetical protein
MNIINPDRLGFYRVGWRKFYHKSLALIESSKTRYDLEWIFNDDVYSAIDWSVPILESLDELYRQRAQQLRDQYDYLTLYFSGGADSANMLRTFVNNNIFLDEIVMQSPEPASHSFNDRDKSSANVYSEIPFSAVPVLKELKNQLDKNTKIRYQDTSKAIIEVLRKDDWFERIPLGVNISINGLARNSTTLAEPHILRLCDSGKKIGQIVGTDKPFITCIDDSYYFYFLDVVANHIPPLDFTQLDMHDKSLHTEFFYWTRDLPQLLIKQAQEVKKVCEFNSHIKMIVCDTKAHVEHLRPILHPIIYPSSSEVPFQVGKADMGAMRAKDNWFWENATKSQEYNFKESIKYMTSNINAKYFKNSDINSGFTGTRSRLYKL